MSEAGAYMQAARALSAASCAVAITGAGISVESGIPSFRDEGGIWEKYPPEEYATLEAYRQDPLKVWRFWRELAESIRECVPNAGHEALAELETMGVLAAVVTQNVDNLHQMAGSQRVVEYHGNSRRLRCLQCDRVESLDLYKFPESPPYCECGELMKPDLVLFGEMIPRAAMQETEALTASCDVLLIVGTSAQVFPVAQVPFEAKARGAFVIEANTNATEFTQAGVTDAFLEGPAGETLPRLVEQVRTRL